MAIVPLVIDPPPPSIPPTVPAWDWDVRSRLAPLAIPSPPTEVALRRAPATLGDGVVVAWTVAGDWTTTRGSACVAGGVVRAEAVAGRHPCRLASLTAT
jgi:hypothetical protein